VRSLAEGLIAEVFGLYGVSPLAGSLNALEQRSHCGCFVVGVRTSQNTTLPPVWRLLRPTINAIRVIEIWSTK